MSEDDDDVELFSRGLIYVVVLVYHSNNCFNIVGGSQDKYLIYVCRLNKYFAGRY
jgi:hypothetical protein